MLSKKGKDFSVTNALLQRSFALLKRFPVKHADAKSTIDKIYQCYLDCAKQGTIQSEEMPTRKEVCPPPGCGNRPPWKDLQHSWAHWHPFESYP